MFSGAVLAAALLVPTHAPKVVDSNLVVHSKGDSRIVDVQSDGKEFSGRLLARWPLTRARVTVTLERDGSSKEMRATALPGTIRHKRERWLAFRAPLPVSKG